jgi:hypothetical protein
MVLHPHARGVTIPGNGDVVPGATPGVDDVWSSIEVMS